jgi:hypothetical protein
MRLKPWAAITFALIGTMFIMFGLHQAYNAGLIPAPSTSRGDLVAKARTQAWEAEHGYMYSNGNDKLVAGVIRDGDTAIAEGAYRAVLNDEITGFAPLDKSLQLVWAHCGVLLLIFGALALLSVLRSTSEVAYDRGGIRRLENENMNWPGGFHDASNLLKREETAP